MPLTIRKTGASDYGQFIKALICGWPGSGKGLTLDTKVLTPSGWTTMGEIKIGDNLIGANGKSVKISHIFDRGILPVYRVSFDDGTSVLCDEDHLWEVQTDKTCRTTHNSFIKSTRELIDSSFIRIRTGKRKIVPKYCIPLVQPVQFELNSNLLIEPYLLGVILAKGSLTDSSLSFKTKDIEIIEMIRSRNPNYEIIEEKETSSRNWTIHKFNPLLRQLKLKDKLSAEKFIPIEYMYSTEDNRRALLAGLMDCDGSASGTRRPQYHTVSPYLRDNIIELVQSLGGIASVYVDNRTDTPYYAIHIELPNSPFWLSRKKNKDLWDSTNMRRWIVDIAPEGQEQTRCIKVDAADELFVVDNYIVTHNTIFSSTFKNPLYASAEGGLMSIADRGIPYVEINSTVELLAIKNSLDQDAETRKQILGFPVDTLVIDTIDEVQRIMKNERLKSTGNTIMQIQDWGWLSEQMRTMVRSFRNMPLHVVFTCHLKEVCDNDTGRIWYAPDLEGSIGGQIPGFVDLALVIDSRTETVTSPKSVLKVQKRRLLTSPTAQYPFLKDRSGKLGTELEVNFIDDFDRINNLIFGGLQLKEEEAIIIESPKTIVGGVGDKDLSSEEIQEKSPVTCEECGGEADKNTIKYSKVKYRKILCATCYDDKKTKKEEK